MRLAATDLTDLIFLDLVSGGYHTVGLEVRGRGRPLSRGYDLFYPGFGDGVLTVGPD